MTSILEELEIFWYNLATEIGLTKKKFGGIGEYFSRNLLFLVLGDNLIRFNTKQM